MKNKSNLVISVIIAILFFMLSIPLIETYFSFNQKVVEKEKEEELVNNLVLIKSLLEKSLNSRIYYTKGIAAYVSLNPSLSQEEFNFLAEQIIQDDSVIHSMSLSKDCIIGAVYPLKGREAAIGLNLLEHPERREIVERTIRTKKAFLSGPVNLVEGGVAFISYMPIFVYTELSAGRTRNNSIKFWGVTDIVFSQEKLFAENNFLPDDGTYKYALRGVDGEGSAGKCFWGDSLVFGGKHKEIDIQLPTGNWVLGAVPSKGWESFTGGFSYLKMIFYAIAIVISGLIGFLSKTVFKIRDKEKELQALFNSMLDVIIKFNDEGRYIAIAPTNNKLLYKPPNELLGKTLHEVFDAQTADFFYSAIRRCIASKELVAIDYPLEIDSGELWFHARISYISRNEVIYVAQDITKRKKYEVELEKSEKELRNLNETKDKFFSIIAHDLRSPFSVLLGLSSILAEEIDTLSKSEVVNFSRELNSSLKQQYQLLTNLLSWSELQIKGLKPNFELLFLREEAEKIIEQVKLLAERKQIQIFNNFSADSIVFADRNLLQLILRNLIANAIKFTETDGKIEINDNKREGFLDISVKDNGTGISSEDQAKLFKSDIKFSTEGTAEERGTGLGLKLCKEAVEKHGGSIRVVSEIGKGSTFIFSIPIKNKQ